MKNRKVKDGILQTLIYLSVFITVGILFFIIGFVLYKGLPGVNASFLVKDWDSKTTFIMVSANNQEQIEEEGFISSLGIKIKQDTQGRIVIEHIEKNSALKEAKDLKDRIYKVKKGDYITKAGESSLDKISLEEATTILRDCIGEVRLKIVTPSGGIKPMLISTLYLIVLSLSISIFIGVFTAVYLNEYAKRGFALKLIRFAIQNLAGIPSIIYGLFGMLVFVQMLQMQYSILAGALTMSIILLPTIISTTEEALKSIPRGYREASLGLGATKLQTNFKIVLPNALPGILVAVVLSIGRIVGESAALIWTAGTVAQIPTALTGTAASAATLTTKMYWLMKEAGDLSTACSIAIILLVLIILLNILSKVISKRSILSQK